MKKEHKLKDIFLRILIFKVVLNHQVQNHHLGITHQKLHLHKVQREMHQKRTWIFYSREWRMYQQLGSNDNETTQQHQQSSSSSASSAMPSNVHQLTQEQMARSRSHTSSERSSEDNGRRPSSSSGSSNKKSR